VYLKSFNKVSLSEKTHNMLCIVIKVFSVVELVVLIYSVIDTCSSNLFYKYNFNYVFVVLLVQIRSLPPWCTITITSSPLLSNSHGFNRL